MEDWTHRDMYHVCMYLQEDPPTFPLVLEWWAGRRERPLVSWAEPWAYSSPVLRPDTAGSTI